MKLKSLVNKKKRAIIFNDSIWFHCHLNTILEIKKPIKGTIMQTSIFIVYKN